MQSAEEKHQRSIRSILLGMGSPIGAAMLIDREMGWNLSFKELPYAEFIDKNEFVCDENALAKVLAMQKPFLCIDPKDYAKRIRLKDREVDDPIELCRGHDFSKIFALCFAKGNPVNFMDKAKDIEDGLRMAFQRAQFEATDLFNKLMQWQENTSGPFRVF